MALKFLNKKGWHTGSLRNIENVWKAEQKHDAEQKKLEELRKQINEERERYEFRQLQEAAGLVPRQERLDFLYESGLAVGKGSSDGFKALQAQPSGGASSSAAESSSSKAAVPGALFEEKPQSANDAWRKLHSDPLLLIRQREQEALTRIKNNPIRMAMIKKSVESEKNLQEVKKDRKKEKNKHKHDGSKKSKEKDLSKCQSDSEHYRDDDDKEDHRNKEKEDKRKLNHANEKHEKHPHKVRGHSNYSSISAERSRNNANSDCRKHSEHYNHSSRNRSGDKHTGQKEKKSSDRELSDKNSLKLSSITNDGYEDIRSQSQQQTVGYKHRQGVRKMTEEERDARLREMQMNAELHEDQRWKRLKEAAEADELEAKQAAYSRGKSFLDATQKSIYGMEEGGSSTIEASVRRRTYYSQGSSAHESNAFRR